MEMVAEATRSFEQDLLITIALDDHDERFTVSKALLCDASDYFRKALSGDFKEAIEKTLKLPGCDVDTFRLFLYYLTNSKALPDTKPVQVALAKETDGKSPKWQSCLVRLWIFGDAYLMPDLQDATLKHLCSYWRMFVVEPLAIELAFEHTEPGSLLRQAFVDTAVCDILHHRDNLANDFMDRVGAIPGFLALFTESLQNQYLLKAKSYDPCYSAKGTEHISAWVDFDEI